MSTMNVLICQQPKELVWKQREIPIPGDNEALIKIKSVGICGTDIHAWGGNQPFFSYPRVLGHEICGEIVGLGKNIADLKNGQQVAVIPYVACQQCPALMNPLMILVKIIKLRWIHILSYDQMVSRKINNQTTRCANSIF
ncbi:alcohol dehydrogenase catalytic domain-containing protein, partial [Escherichia coli]|uniref:alcohol dehydrogenase catalytic domain-containing protein n=2 Tax=Escherichia coli TaxID=562 RepID=UPI00208DC2C7